MAERAKEDGWKMMPNGKPVFVHKGQTLKEAFEQREREKDKKSEENKHREYLKQNSFKKVDEYDEQILHDGNKQNTIKKNDMGRLEDEVSAFEKSSTGPFIKDRHVSNLRANIDKKLSDIQSQMKYMKDHDMEDTALYKQLKTFSTRLKNAKNNLNGQ